MTPSARPRRSENLHKSTCYLAHYSLTTARQQVTSLVGNPLSYLSRAVLVLIHVGPHHSNNWYSHRCHDQEYRRVTDAII